MKKARTTVAVMGDRYAGGNWLGQEEIPAGSVVHVLEANAPDAPVDEDDGPVSVMRFPVRPVGFVEALITDWSVLKPDPDPDAGIINRDPVTGKHAPGCNCNGCYYD